MTGCRKRSWLWDLWKLARKYYRNTVTANYKSKLRTFKPQSFWRAGQQTSSAFSEAIEIQEDRVNAYESDSLGRKLVHESFEDKVDREGGRGWRGEKMTLNWVIEEVLRKLCSDWWGVGVVEDTLVGEFYKRNVKMRVDFKGYFWAYVIWAGAWCENGWMFFLSISYSKPSSSLRSLQNRNLRPWSPLIRRIRAHPD